MHHRAQRKIESGERGSDNIPHVACPHANEVSGGAWDTYTARSGGAVDDDDDVDAAEEEGKGAVDEADAVEVVSWLDDARLDVLAVDVGTAADDATLSALLPKIKSMRQ